MADNVIRNLENRLNVRVGKNLMALGDEKLEFSMQDLGRLGKYMESQTRISHPIILIQSWLMDQVTDLDESQRIISGVVEGYMEK